MDELATRCSCNPHPHEQDSSDPTHAGLSVLGYAAARDFWQDRIIRTALCCSMRCRCESPLSRLLSHVLEIIQVTGSVTTQSNAVATGLGSRTGGTARGFIRYAACLWYVTSPVGRVQLWENPRTHKKAVQMLAHEMASNNSWVSVDTLVSGDNRGKLVSWDLIDPLSSAGNQLIDPPLQHLPRGFGTIQTIEDLSIDCSGLDSFPHEFKSVTVDRTLCLGQVRFHC